MINLGIFTQAKYRLWVWFVLLATVLLYLKFNIAEPFPKIHQQIVSYGAIKQYEKIPPLVEVGRDVYSKRYFETQLGFHHAEALRELGKIEESQKYILEYMEKTTVNLHNNTHRLLADNYLDLKEIEKGLQILSQLFKILPHRNLDILEEIQYRNPNFDVSAHLDPIKDEFAMDVLKSYQTYLSKSAGYSGKVDLPQRNAQPLKKSLYFTVAEVKTTPKGETTLVTGKISSRINLSLMGFRLKAVNAQDLYLDEQDCTVNNLTKGQAQSFSCTLMDSSPIKTLTFQELRYEI